MGIWKANNENVETNFLYAEVMVRVSRAAGGKGPNGAAAGKKRCSIM